MPAKSNGVFDHSEPESFGNRIDCVNQYSNTDTAIGLDIESFLAKIAWEGSDWVCPCHV